MQKVKVVKSDWQVVCPWMGSFHKFISCLVNNTIIFNFEDHVVKGSDDCMACTVWI